MIDIKHSIVTDDMADAVLQVLKAGKLAGAGSIIEEYEQCLAEEFQSEFAVACSSGTTAVSLAIMASDITAGSSIAVPSIVPTMTPLAVIAAGCIPHFVDIESADGVGVCFDQLRALARTEKISGVIATSMWGYPSSEDKLADLCKDLNIVLIEDASHAHMATLNEKRLGTFGQIGAFSTHERKLLFTGEGGFCLTNNRDLATRLRALREFGRLGKSGTFAERLGYNFKLASPLAALGLAQVRDLAKRISNRRKIWSKLYDITVSSPWASPIDLPANAQPSTYGFLALGNTAELALHLQTELEAVGVLSDTKKYNHRPVYEIGVLRNFHRENCPNSIDFCQRAIALPAHEGVADNVLEKIETVLGGSAR